MVEHTLGVLHNITKNPENIRKHPKKGREPSLRSYDVTSCDVIFGSYAISCQAQWYILYYYYSKKKAREKLSLLVIFVGKKGGKPSFPVLWRHFRLHPLVMLLPVMRSGIFCTTTIVKNRWEKISLPVRAASGDVTSGHAYTMAQSSHLIPPKYDLNGTDMLLYLECSVRF